MICSYCGNESTGKFCAYCGAPLAPAPQGKDAEKASSTSDHEMNQQQVETESPKHYREVAEPLTETKRPIYKKTWFIIFMLFLFFPIGLYLMWKHSSWNKVAKIIITALFVFFFVSTIVDSNSSETQGSIVLEQTHKSTIYIA